MRLAALIDGYATGGVSNLFRQRQGFRTGNIAKLPEFLKFVERLLIKASNEIRQGIGKWKGLTTSQKVTQHDNLTKLATEFQKTKKFDVRINEYTGIDAEKAFIEAQSKVKKTVPEVPGDTYLEALDKRIMKEMELTKTEMDNMSSTALDDLRRMADPIGMEKNLGEITPGRGIGDFADDPNFLRDVKPVKTKKVDKNRKLTEEEWKDFVEENSGDLNEELLTGDETLNDLENMVAQELAYADDMYRQYKSGALDKYVKPEVLEEQRLFRQKKIDKVLDKAYDEVFYQKPVTGDYKLDADVLSDSIAEQLGKGEFTDLPQTHQTQIYNTALKRVTQDMQMKRTLKKVEKAAGKKGDVSDQTIKEIKDEVKDVSEKMILEDFDVTGRKKNASGGLIPGYATGGVSNLFRRR